MLYQGSFDDPQAAVSSLILHAVALGVDLVSVTVDQGIVVVETGSPFPTDQLDHLGIAEV